MDVHLFETDAYDREAREAALAGPAVEALCEKGGRLLPHMRALVEDLFALYFKLHLRKREVPLSAALNRRIVEAAVRLCAVGLQRMEYKTQWASGATVWRAVIDGRVVTRVVPAK